ncbi:hypothetical protein [Hyphomonas sp.]|uniref:hypothetical protein n=1 Tax=Hyphomonas sp. TaxID=87 RepID=UPI00391D3A37
MTGDAAADEAAGGAAGGVAATGQRGGRLRAPLLIALFALLMALPAIVNGKPFIFYDTVQYYEIGEQILSRIAPAPEGEAQAAAPPEALIPDDPGAGAVEAEIGGGYSTIGAGRSPVYALFLYCLTQLASLWAVVAMQALIVAALVYRLLQVLAPKASLGGQIALVGALALLTPLGFHVGFLMPDIFGGVFLLAALILLFDRAPGWPLILVLTGLMAFSATMHATNMALGLILLAVILAGRFLPGLRHAASLNAAGAAAAAVIASLAFGELYRIGVERFTGSELRNAPYLAGRVIADGPGERFLAERCEGSELAICRFSGVDYVDHNDFLWGGAGNLQNWVASPIEVRNAVQAEERDFVIAAVAAYPGMQLAASLQNTMMQLWFFGIRETSNGAEMVVQTPNFAETSLMQKVPGLDGCAEGVRCEPFHPVREGWGVTVHTATLIVLTGWLVLLALYLRPALLQPAAMEPRLRDCLLAGGLVILVLLANAALCGALSGPHDRYQARLAWVPALLAGLGLLHVMSRRADETPA